MDSPFIYGKTVSLSAFTDREDSLEKLYKNLHSGINTLLIAPRRWGKSSLVEKLIQKIRKEDKDTKVVSIDLFSINNEDEFLELFARKIIQASSDKWEEWLRAGKEFFKHLTPQFTVGNDPVNDFKVSFDWQAIKKHKDEILNLPETIAQKKNRRFIICLDEFQNLADFPEFKQLEKTMRAHWQRQKKTTYCLYGSKRHMMTDIFNNPSKPFYRFGELMILPKIKREKWTAFIQEKFDETGKSISATLAEKIAALMKDHSWYVQQLSHYTWQKTNKKAKISYLKDALSELIATNIPFYQREVMDLSSGQINLLKAIAKSEKQLTAKSTIEKYRLGTSGTVVKNRNTLMKEDIIDIEDTLYYFLDPAFEMWFKKEFLEIPWSVN